MYLHRPMEERPRQLDFGRVRDQVRQAPTVARREQLDGAAELRHALDESHDVHVDVTRPTRPKRTRHVRRLGSEWGETGKPIRALVRV